MTEFEIILEDIRLFARHGVFEHETRDGNEFEVNLSVSYPASDGTSTQQSSESDNIDSTVSYARLFEIIREEMALPRKLLETVASSIIKRIKTEYPYISAASCKISKIIPPISGFTGRASVSYKYTS